MRTHVVSRGVLLFPWMDGWMDGEMEGGSVDNCCLPVQHIFIV